MTSTTESSINQCYTSLSENFDHWEKTKDLIDQVIDIILNYRQSGHPGGSRSKVACTTHAAAKWYDALGYPASRKTVR